MHKRTTGFLFPIQHTIHEVKGENSINIISSMHWLENPLHPARNRGKQAHAMDQYLKRIDRSSLQIPDLVPLTSYIPEEVPLLDYLIMFTESEENSWVYPRVSLLKQFQNDRGLSYESLGACNVCEIFIGETPVYEIENLKIWLLDQMERDEISLPCSGLPFDTHTQRVTLYDL